MSVEANDVIIHNRKVRIQEIRVLYVFALGYS
jgi:hypothetical protein